MYMFLHSEKLSDKIDCTKKVSFEMKMRTVSRDKVITLMILLSFVFIVFYYYLHHLQENYSNAQWSGERCLSELTSIKYQLNVVTEYKDRIDKLLTDTQKRHESDKEKFKDIMESCVAMKLQSSICQSQFEDLQQECMNLREENNKLYKEIDKLKPAS